MGMDNDGMPLGINKSLIQKMKKDFVNTLNSPDKMSPTLYLEIEEIEYSSGTTLLWVFVPPAATVIKCINRIYDRNEDGDMDITDSPIQVENLYILKSGSFSEKRIFPYVTEAELRMDLFDNIRQLAKSHNTNHPWITMTDKEIITSAGLFEKDYDSGEQGYNLAAILLL